MNFALYILSVTFLTLFFQFFLKQNKILINDVGDSHQKFTSNKKVTLTGGILIFLGICYFFNKEFLNFYLFLSSIFILGIASDLQLVKSAIWRFFFQISIVIFFVILDNLHLSDTRIFFLDKLLQNDFFNYLFISFCILIALNGSNFIDGLNGLCIGYYSLICGVIILLGNGEYIVTHYNFFNYLIIILLICFFINILNLFFLGDSGSYLLGSMFSFLLIKIYSFNQNLSPFFIILLLWYPCFETLFSMIRKINFNKSPMKPDNKHLHQLIFLYFNKKVNYSVYLSNNISSIIINAYNLIIFLIGMNFISNTKVQLSLIILNLILYTIIYLKCLKINKSNNQNL